MGRLTSYPEPFVLHASLLGSPLLTRYYQAERNKIGGEVYWVEDPTLSELADVVRSANDTRQVVRLRSIPALPEDGATVAHELAHLVLDWQGFPSVAFGNPEVQSVAAALSSCLQDPIVDQHLCAYGLDLVDKYTREAAQSRASISGITDPPEDHIGIALWITNIASNIIDWTIASRVGVEVQSDFETWLASRFPQLAANGRLLAERMLLLTFAEPATMSRAFGEAVAMLHLEGLMKVSQGRRTA